MKILVCGGRTYKNYAKVCEILNIINVLCPIETIVHGGAKGADSLASKYAKDHNLLEKEYVANWGLYGRSAGFIRNIQMLEEEHPDIVLAFPGGKGTEHTCLTAEGKGIRVIRIKKMI